MNRIEMKLNDLKQQGKKAVIKHMVAGFPKLDTMAELIKEQEMSGADMIQLAIPFSDPVADGPAIQNASVKALANGANLRSVFKKMCETRELGIQIPVIFKMYYNTLMHYGIDEFIRKCMECGVDGVLIPDLPFEEQKELQEEIDKYEDAPILIEIVSERSKQRIPLILKNARGYVFCDSLMGKNKCEENFTCRLTEYLSYVKKNSVIPVMLEQGMLTDALLEMAGDMTDGVISDVHY